MGQKKIVKQLKVVSSSNPQTVIQPIQSDKFRGDGKQRKFFRHS